MADGEWVFVAGTTGFDYATMTISDDVAEQADQALRTIAAALEQAGASLDDVVRVRYLFPDADDFPACWPVFRRHLGVALPDGTLFPNIVKLRHFRCEGCGSTDATVTPDWRGMKAPGMGGM